MKNALLALVVAIAALQVAALHPAEHYAVHLVPGESARAIAARVPAARWLGLGDTLVLEVPAGTALAGLRRVARALAPPAGSDLALVLSKHGTALPPPLTGVVLARHSGFALAALAAGSRRDATDPHVEVRPVPWNRVVSERLPERATKAPRDAVLDALVAKVTPAGVLTDTQKLVDFKTRHTLSTGYEAAAAWVESELKAAGLTTSRHRFSIGGRSAENVIGEIPGQAGVDDVYVMGGHLDSINYTDGMAYAPGADDNGSGSACVLAIARALAGTKPRATLRFILFGGEEEGLIGSHAYVDGLSPAELARIKGALMMDMTAYRKNVAGVTLEGREVSRELSDLTADLASRYTPLKIERSWDAWGSDHVPFLDANVPTLLTIELDYPVNGNEHGPRDTMNLIDADQAAAIARTDLAVLATLSGIVKRR